MKSVVKGLGLVAIGVGILFILGWLTIPTPHRTIWPPIFWGLIGIGGYFLYRYGNKGKSASSTTPKQSALRALGVAAIVVGLIGIYGWWTMPAARSEIWPPILWGAIGVGGGFLIRYGSKGKSTPSTTEEPRE